VAHALEGLWTNISRSHLKRDRAFCQVRHSMHFFVSNLLFHLQVPLTADCNTMPKNSFLQCEIECQNSEIELNMINIVDFSFYNFLGGRSGF
jgi:hypothetical protein